MNLIESRSKDFFQESINDLILIQNERRDNFIDATKAKDFKVAKHQLELLQLVGVALQACQQSLERYQQEEKRAAETAPTVDVTPAAEESK